MEEKDLAVMEGDLGFSLVPASQLQQWPIVLVLVI